MIAVRHVANLLIFLPMVIGVSGLLFRIRGDRIWGAGLFALSMALLGTLVAWISTHLGLPISAAAWKLGRWAGHWQYEVGFKIDFFSSGQGLIVVWLMLTGYLIGRKSFLKHRSKLTASLTLSTAVMGAVFSANLLSFLVFSSLASMFSVLLLGRDRSEFAAVDSVRLGMAALASELLLLICVLGTNKSLMTGDIFQFSVFGQAVRGETVLFFIFMLAAFLKAPILPLHPQWSSIYRSSETEHLLPIAVLGGLGLYLIFRFAPELYPAQLREHSRALMLLGMFSIVAGGVYLFRARGARAWLFASGLVFSGLAVSGFASLTPMGWLGAWVVYWFGALALAFSVGLCIVAERRPRTFGADVLQEAPLFALASTGALLSVTGMPVTVLYFGIVFIYGGATQSFGGFFWVALISLPLILGGAIYRLFFHFQAGAASVDSGSFTDLNRSEQAALFPLLIFLILTLVGSSLILDGIGRAVKGSIAVLGLGA